MPFFACSMKKKPQTGEGNPFFYVVVFGRQAHFLGTITQNSLRVKFFASQNPNLGGGGGGGGGDHELGLRDLLRYVHNLSLFPATLFYTTINLSYTLR